MAASELSRYQANLQDEIDGVALYRALAEVETDPALAGIYGRLADAEPSRRRAGDGLVVHRPGRPGGSLSGGSSDRRAGRSRR